MGIDCVSVLIGLYVLSQPPLCEGLLHFAFTGSESTRLSTTRSVLTHLTSHHALIHA